jgi:hypothetical protein
VLLRGFAVGGVDGFGGLGPDAIRVTAAGLRRTIGPRRTIKGKVYASTDYPPNEEIFLPNEDSYQVTFTNGLLRSEQSPWVRSHCSPARREPSQIRGVLAALAEGNALLPVEVLRGLVNPRRSPITAAHSRRASSAGCTNSRRASRSPASRPAQATRKG